MPEKIRRVIIAWSGGIAIYHTTIGIVGATIFSMGLLIFDKQGIGYVLTRLQQLC